MKSRFLLVPAFAAALAAASGCAAHRPSGADRDRSPDQSYDPPPRPAATGSLDDTSWHIAAVGGERTPLSGDLLADDVYAVDFAGGSIMGYGGCNRFTGSYALAGDLLTVTLGGSTRGACAPTVMAREHRLFEILGSPVRIRRVDRRRLLLANERGEIELVRSSSGTE